MKLMNITLKNGKSANLNLKKEDKMYLPNEEFEVSEERGKELLEIKIDGNPIVKEIIEVKETKPKKPQTQEVLEEQDNTDKDNNEN